MKIIVVLLAILVPNISGAVLVTSGNGVILGTWNFDFESGSMTTAFDPNGDIWWEQISDTERQISPSYINAGLDTAAQLAILGAVDFDAVTEADLIALTYSENPIPGPPSGTDLNVGNVFAVLTSEGNFAKVKVTGYEDGGNPVKEYYDMHIQYAVYDGVPEPATLALLALGIAGIGYQRRRKAT